MHSDNTHYHTKFKGLFAYTFIIANPQINDRELLIDQLLQFVLVGYGPIHYVITFSFIVLY